jgi:hypothetical protein
METTCTYPARQWTEQLVRHLRMLRLLARWRCATCVRPESLQGEDAWTVLSRSVLLEGVSAWALGSAQSLGLHHFA